MRKTWIILFASVALTAASALIGADAATQPANGALTADQEAELLDFLQRMGSEQYDRLTQLRQVNPTTYQTTAKAWHSWMMSIRKYPESVQRACVVQQESYTRINILVNDLSVAVGDVQRAALVDQLRQQVTMLFDAQMTIREHRLEELRRQLQKLQEEHERNKAQREALIDESVRRWTQAASQPRPPASQPVSPTGVRPASQPEQ